MRFIHISDVHIGARPDSDYPWGIQREKEILSNFGKLIETCNEQEIDLLLIAGDLFHRQPLIRELKEVNYLFGKLKKTKVVFMAGNHDFIGIRSHYTGFLWNDNVHMLMEEDMDSIYLEELNTEVYGFSYHKREITESKYDKIHPGCKERINILLAHGGNEKNIPMNKKVMLSNGFDYIALGHIHKPELFGDRMAYAGSFEPLDKTETGDRGYIKGEIIKQEDDSTISINFVPNSIRKYIPIELACNKSLTNGAVLDMASHKIKEYGCDNIYIFILKGIRDPDIELITDDFKSLGNVIEIIDETAPDYDFDVLYQDNKDNIIGLYINKIRESADQDEVTNKALYLGIQALLGAKSH